MDGWMVRWMVRWMDGWMNGWMDGPRSERGGSLQMEIFSFDVGSIGKREWFYICIVFLHGKDLRKSGAILLRPSVLVDPFTVKTVIHVSYGI